MTSKLLLPLVASLWLLAPHASAQGVFSVVSSNNNTSLFAFALQLSGLSSFFNDATENMTVFAPSDAAFYAALGQLGLSQNDLATNAETMAPILKYHAVTPKFTLADIDATTSYYLTLAGGGSNLAVREDAALGKQVISLGSSANITEAMDAGNSTIMVIDNVLLPFYVNLAEAITRPSQQSMFAGYATQYAPKWLQKLRSSTVQYTVFAPINSGFTRQATNTVLSELLSSASGVQYLLDAHIVPATSVSDLAVGTTKTLTTLSAHKLQVTRVNNTTLTVTLVNGTMANIVYPDVNVGITNTGTFRSSINVIDNVLVPSAAAPAALAPRADLTSYVATVDTNGAYANIINGHDNGFSGTILMPTNAAMDAWLSAMGITYAQLAANPTATRQILDLCMIPNVKLSLSNLTNGQQLTTNAGSNTVTVRITNSITSFDASGSSANAVGEEYILSDAVVGIAISYVLMPAGFNLNNGAALLMSSPLTVLLSSVFAIFLLHVFSRH